MWDEEYRAQWDSQEDNSDSDSQKTEDGSDKPQSDSQGQENQNPDSNSDSTDEQENEGQNNIEFIDGPGAFSSMLYDKDGNAVHIQQAEDGNYYDENGVKQEMEIGPSFDDFPGMAKVTSPIPICHACRKADFDEKGYETLCKVYGKIPSKHLKAKDYNCPYLITKIMGGIS